MVKDEVGGLLIGLESKFFRDESDVHVGFVAANTESAFHSPKDIQ